MFINCWDNAVYMHSPGTFLSGLAGKSAFSPEVTSFLGSGHSDGPGISPHIESQRLFTAAFQAVTPNLSPRASNSDNLVEASGKVPFCFRPLFNVWLGGSMCIPRFLWYETCYIVSDISRCSVVAASHSTLSTLVPRHHHFIFQVLM